MIKVKTFTNELKIFETKKELDELDNAVNSFIEAHEIKKVISVSDTTTATDEGSAGIIRVLTFEV